MRLKLVGTVDDASLSIVRFGRLKDFMVKHLVRGRRLTPMQIYML